jgi:hypothetical protein
MHDVKSHDVHLTAKQLAPLEPGEQLAPFHEELPRFKLLFISTSRHPQTIGTSRHPQTIGTPRHPQTIGTSRHRYKSQSHFAIALELADRLYHYIWQFKLHSPVRTTQAHSGCQNNPSALWLVVAPIALLARFVAIKHLPACATVWPPNWPTAQPPTRNSKTAIVAWHQVERHGTFAQQILFACNTYVIITMIMEFEVVSDVAVLVDAEPSCSAVQKTFLSEQ